MQKGKFGRNRSKVWTYPGVNSFRAGRMEDLAAHPTVKPLRLVADALKDVTRPGDVVLGSFWSIMSAIFLSGFLNIGVQLSLNAYITNYYPTSLRGTGVGWATLVGRTGSLVGPLIGGILASQGIGAYQLFQLSAVAPLLACISLIVF